MRDRGGLVALTMADGVITVDDEGDPVAVAARLRQLEEQIAGMPAEAVDAMGADIGSVQWWLSSVLAKVTARATRYQQQGQRSDPKKKAFEDRSDRLVADVIAELEKQRRQSRAKAWVDPLTGMTHLHGEWDPVRGEAIRRALDDGQGQPLDVGRERPDQHHHLVHEGGWTLTRNQDGTGQLNPPQRPPP